jgi:type II secretory pathway pseudopilin PulG
MSIVSKSDRKGFSILELASVLAILLLILGATMGAFLGWQHGAAVRGAEDQVYAALSNARQIAILRRMPVGLALGVTTNAPGYPPRGYCFAFTNDFNTPVSETAFLPLRSFLSVSNAWETIHPDLGPFVIQVLPDGRTQTHLDSDPVVVTIGITRNGGTSTSRSIRLDPLTGIPRSPPSLGGEP